LHLIKKNTVNFNTQKFIKNIVFYQFVNYLLTVPFIGNIFRWVIIQINQTLTSPSSTCGFWKRPNKLLTLSVLVSLNLLRKDHKLYCNFLTVHTLLNLHENNFVKIYSLIWYRYYLMELAAAIYVFNHFLLLQYAHNKTNIYALFEVQWMLSYFWFHNIICMCNYIIVYNKKK
jgi:hypothetical protein